MIKFIKRIIDGMIDAKMREIPVIREYLRRLNKDENRLSKN